MKRHSLPSSSYPASCYDDQMCLKPPLLLWAATLYLSRALTLPIAMAIGHFAQVDDKAISVFRAFWSIDALIPSLIAVVVLYALYRRLPTASRPVRWLWAHGQILLVLAALFDMALISLQLIRHGEISDQSLPLMLAVAGDVYFLVYILAARRVRDAFSEFPVPLEPARPASSAGG